MKWQKDDGSHFWDRTLKKIKVKSGEHGHETRETKIGSWEICDGFGYFYGENQIDLEQNELNVTKNETNANKPDFRAKENSLLTLALRPSLLGRGAVAVLGFSALVLLLNAANVVDVSAASLTLSVPSSTLSLEITPNGQFKKSSEANITAKTDALAGYTLSVKSNTDNKLMNDTYELNSITEKVTEEQYNQEGNSNTWGYNLIKNKAEMTDNNTNFLPGPTTEESTIDKTSAKNDENNTYTITLGAKVDTTLPTGIYTNTFVFLASANSFEYTITYDLQGGSGGPSPTTQTKSTIDATIKLDSTPPTKSGYEFLGWCSVEPINNNSATPTCSGTTYQPGGDYTFASSDSSTLTLYAMWKAAGNYMQNWNGCSTLSEHQTVELIDSRDNNTYTVAKLKDGKCWMVNDLRLGSNETTTLLTPETSDVASNFTLPRGSLAFSSSNYNAANFYLHTEKGGYYSWNAVTAGTKIGTGNSGDATSSVCPRGWRLPTGGTSGEFGQMAKYYGDGNNTSSSTRLALSAKPVPGFDLTRSIGKNNSNDMGSRDLSVYWSSTAADSTLIYTFVFWSSYIEYRNEYSLSDGYGVRCISRE